MVSENHGDLRALAELETERQGSEKEHEERHSSRGRTGVWLDGWVVLQIACSTESNAYCYLKPYPVGDGISQAKCRS